MVRQRVRIRFCQTGRFASDWTPGPGAGHRADISPRRAATGDEPGISSEAADEFPLALAVGIEGEDEVMEVEWAETARGRGTGAAAGARGPGGPDVPAAWRFRRPGRGRPGRAALPTRPACRRRGAGPAEERRPAVGRDLLALAAPRRAGHGDRPPRRLCWNPGLAGDVLRCVFAPVPRRRSGPRNVLAALGLGDSEAEGVRIDAHRRGARALIRGHPLPSASRRKQMPLAALADLAG